MKRKLGSFWKVNCPVCLNSFRSDEIERHASRCGDSSSSTAVAAPTKAPTATIVAATPSSATPSATPSSSSGEVVRGGINAFSRMLAAQSQLKKTKLGSTAEFRLDLIDGKLVPTFRFASDSDQPQSPSAIPAVWSDECSVRKFSMTLSDDGEQGVRGTNDTDGYQQLSVTLSTNVPSETPPGAGIGGDTNQGRPPPPAGPVPTALLKSMLQKGVRRRLVGPVRRLCAALLRQSPVDCLRRVPVIMMEDSSLHPALPVLVWLMMALSKGYEPSTALQAVVVLASSELAMSRCRDRPDPPILAVTPFSPALAPTPLSTAGGPVPVSLQLSDLPLGAPRTLVASLLLRAAYGGMAGDCSMLEGFARRWAQRFFPTAFGTTTSEEWGSVRRCPPPSLSVGAYLSSEAGGFMEDLWASSPWGAAGLLAYSDEGEGKGEGVLDPNSRYTKDVASLLQIYNKGIAGGGISLPELPLQPSDLVPEGIDQHCDFKMLSHLTETRGAAVRSCLAAEIASSQSASASVSQPAVVSDEEVNLAISSALWLFRSSTNTRGETWLRPMGADPHQDLAAALHSEELLAMKKAKSKVWACIAKEASLYVSARVAELSRRLPGH